MLRTVPLPWQAVFANACVLARLRAYVLTCYWGLRTLNTMVTPKIPMTTANDTATGIL